MRLLPGDQRWDVVEKDGQVRYSHEVCRDDRFETVVVRHTRRMPAGTAQDEATSASMAFTLDENQWHNYFKMSFSWGLREAPARYRTYQYAFPDGSEALKIYDRGEPKSP